MQRIVVHGEFLAERTLLLDNKMRHHRPGYEVVTPLRLAEGIHVLVNRGWIEAPRERDQLPAVSTPPGRVRVEGRVLERLPQPFKLGAGGKGRVRQSIELKEFALESGLALQAFVIEQHAGAGRRAAARMAAAGRGHREEPGLLAAVVFARRARGGAVHRAVVQAA